MKRIILICLTCTYLFNGCATKNYHQFVDQVAVDLAKSFDLSNEKFDKFKVSQINDQISVDTNKKEAHSKNNIKKKIENKKNKRAIKIIAKKLEKKTTAAGAAILKSELPVDYPESYKKWNESSANIWKKFKSNVYPGEEMIMEISFLGITVGAVKLKTGDVVEMGDNKVFNFSATLKSANYYSMIYKLNDTLSTYVDTNSFLPMKYTLTQRESGQSVDDLQLYDHEKLKTFFWYKRLKKGVETKQEKSGFIPKYMQNIFSSLYFVRGLPLTIGTTLVYPIVTRTKIWMMTMTVEKKEEIKLLGKWIKAIKINAFTIVPGEKKKNGTISFWYSDDSEKKLLKFKANVKIGHVEGTLIEYHAGRHYEDK
jgi:hypothetical protein